jgi:hypothetical protein
VALPLLALIALGPAIFTTQTLVPGRYSTDLNQQFRHSITFAAGEIARGNLPLWNPHIYGGQSFIGAFQSALFYPPNALHLLLPLRWSINAFVLLHLLIAGWSMFGWSRHRGCGTSAGLVAASMFMFGAAFYLRLQAGHLTILAAGAWLPLLFWNIDHMIDRPTVTAVLTASAAATLMLLAGHPQTAYYTALAAALYVAMRLFQAPRPLASIGALAMAALLAGLMASVQALPGLEWATQGLRSSGADPRLAASFSLPPENLLTLLSPTLLGDAWMSPYWGRWYYWEMSLYAGVLGAALALVGGLFSGRKQRRFAGIMVLALVLLALGAYTPIFEPLRHALPGFDRFRGTCKFSLQATLFLALLGGVGAQRLISGPGPARLVVILLALAAAVLGAAGWWIHHCVRGAQVDPHWLQLLASLSATGQSYVPAEVYADPGFAARIGRHAATALLVSAILLTVGALLFALARQWRWAARAVVVLTVGELLAFAWLSTRTIDLNQGWPPELAAVMQRQPADARVLNTTQPNVAQSLNGLDVWGYDPTVSRRYAELIAFTQGVAPDDAGYHVTFRQPHRLLAMLRCHEIIGYKPDGSLRLARIDDPLPRLLILDDYEVALDRDEILAAMSAGDFDPRFRVVLEQPPKPKPARGATGSIRVLEQDTDHLALEVDLSAAAILLITDNFDAGWRALALPGSVQKQYDVMPADYVLRAVPMTAGKHRLELVYEPRTWRAALALSGVGAAMWLGLLVLRLMLRRRAAAGTAPAA